MAVPQGPAKGANLILVLIDRLLATDAQRKPLEPATNRLLVAVLSARDTASDGGGAGGGGRHLGRAQGCPRRLPELRRRQGRAEPQRARRRGRRGLGGAKSRDGDRLTLGLSYRQGVPALLSFDQKTYSGADPSFFRIYRGDWGVDAVRSSVAGIDRVTRLELAASGPLLGRLLDGSQELIDVSAVPWYRRDSFLP